MTGQLATLLDNLAPLGQYLLVRRLAVLAAWLLAAKIADLAIDRIFVRLARRSRITFDDQAIGLLHRPVCWTMAGIGLLHGASLQPPWPEPVGDTVRSALLLLWGVTGYRLLDLGAGRLRQALMDRGTVGRDIFHLVHNVLRVALLGATGFWLLAVWEVDLTPLFASAGIAGIAVALAAKDTLANFFGGISIFVDRVFAVGDYIIIDDTDRGEVVDIGIRSTRIKTRDDVLITIPNSILANAKIVNESAPRPRFRIRIPVGVAYGSDLDQVERVLLEVAAANPAVVPEPKPRVRLRRFGDSSVDFELLCWIDDPAFKGLETHNLLRRIYSAFEAEGITIPFPQRDVHLVPQGGPAPRSPFSP